MSTLPPALDTLTPDQFRQKIAGCLIDHQAEKANWFNDGAKAIAIDFCAALPLVFGEELDRMTMWDKIANAIQSGYAKTVDGDVEMFTQHVLTSIKANPARAVACDQLADAIDSLLIMQGEQRQDWLTYLVNHLVPVLVHARRKHKAALEARK